MATEKHIVNKLKSITEQIKTMRDSDNNEFFKIKIKDDCCSNVCELMNIYLNTKLSRLDYIDKQISNINNTSISFRPDNIESWIGRANGEAKKLRKQILFKISEIESLKNKIPCNCT